MSCKFKTELHTKYMGSRTRVMKIGQNIHPAVGSRFPHPQSPTNKWYNHDLDWLATSKGINCSSKYGLTTPSSMYIYMYIYLSTHLYSSIYYFLSHSWCNHFNHSNVITSNLIQEILSSNEAGRSYNLSDLITHSIHQMSSF